MRTLAPERVRWVFVHTVGGPGSWTVEDIRRWHVEDNGWSDIGYHFYIRRDGSIHTGRNTDYVGAHVRGVNSQSIGICCEGDGDNEPHTEPQRDALLAMCYAMMERYGLGPWNVLGHREVNDLIDAGIVDEKYRTGKTCPGLMVDMDEIRDSLLPPPPRVDRLAGPGPAEYLRDRKRAA